MESQPSSTEQQPSLSYLSPSTALVNAANFISMKLQWFPDTQDTNYATWKKQMMCLMKSQGLMGYIDGSISPPTVESDYNIWSRNDALVMGWILGWLSDPIASIVIKNDFARDVWSQLEGKFGRPSLPQREQLPTLGYPSPSIASVNVANFVSTKLQWLPEAPNETNYGTWREQMLCLMQSQGLMKYIDGSISPPFESSHDYNVWNRNNALVKGWILGSLSDQIASTMLGMMSAEDVWSHLKEQFDQPSMFPPLAYPRPATASVNVANFVSTKLHWLPEAPNKTNYGTWREQMQCLMESQGLMKYIDGSISPPSESSHDYNVWKRNNSLVKGWILGSLSDQIASTTVGMMSAEEVWCHLEKEFGEPSPFPALLYLSPSTVSINVANFISTKLHWLPDVPAETNYEIWKKQMLCLIESQGLKHYIDDKLTSLPLLSNQDSGARNRNDTLIKGWILGSLSDVIAPTVMKLDSAQEIWYELEKKFGQPKRTCLVEPKINKSTKLHRAVLNGDWATAARIFTDDPKAKTNWIDGNQNWKPLHVAMGIGRGNNADNFVRELLQALVDEDLENHTDMFYSTALHVAAAVGNITAAKLLVEKQPKLCYTMNRHRRLPIHVAALYRQREVLEYLVEHTTDQNPLNPYTGAGAQKLLAYLIRAEFYDIALSLAESYPRMLRITDPDHEDSPLNLLVIKKHALNTRKLNFRARLGSSLILRFERNQGSRSALNTTDDIEATTRDATNKSSVLCPDLQRVLRKCIDFLAPGIRERIKADRQARQLLQRMCEEIGWQDFSSASNVFHQAIYVAAEWGVREVVKAIIDAFPGALHSFARPSGQHIFQKAIENRSLDVFNLFYEMDDDRIFFISYYVDNYGNTPLHSAAKLAPPHKLNEISGAALQMQREIQWFKEVEKILHPYNRERKNAAGKTPKMVFTEEHSLLKESGERWMRETANSFTLVAVLISTVMFTGAITVPGGNESNTGFPIFSKELGFITFAVSDAVSLFASTTSLLLFLSILTSRYAEEDFLYSLPRRLMYATATLILSIISMMVSFIATIYLVFGHKRHWALFPLLISACMPVTAFVPYQSVLLYELYSSTYGHGLFGKKSKRRFYGALEGNEGLIS